MNKADDVASDLKKVLSLFSTAEQKLASLDESVNEIYAVSVDTYESLPYPIVRHTFYGRTVKEATGYMDSHRKTDEFFRGCEKGNWKNVKCKNTRALVNKTQVSAVKASGGPRPSMLKKSIIGQLQNKKRK